MNIALIVLSLPVCVAVHEAAHALALRRLGIPISHAGLGLPLWPVLSIRGPRWPFTFTLSPWLVGAYVRPDEEYEDQIDALPYRAQAWYLNAGIVANLILGFALVGAGAALNLNFTKAALCLGAAGALWPLRRLVAAYILPVLAVPALCVIVVAIRAEWEAGRTGVGFADLGDADLAPHGFAAAVASVGIMSIALALMNMLPLFGLDNGKVVDMLLHRWAPHWVVTGYRYGGLALIAITLVASVGSDLWALWTAVS